MLQASSITKRYKVGQSHFVALHKASFVLLSTGLVAIYGKSGSGKTTLLNLLSGLDEPSSGTLYFKGKTINRDNRTSYLRNHVGFIFQHYNLIEKMTVLENVTLASKIAGKKRKHRHKVKALLEGVGLWDLRHRNVDTLSGGEKQRVAICRALIKDPDILFADEPTGALDEENAKAVMEILKEESKNRLVVFVTHNPEFVSDYGESKIHVSDGHVRIESPFMGEEIRKKNSRGIRGLWTSRFVLRNMKRNFGKNLLALLSGTIGFSSLLLTLGFYLGNASAIEREGYRILGCQTAYLSEEEKVEVPNSPLTLLRQKKPALVTALDALEGIPSVTFETDYSSFLPDILPFALEEEKQDPVRFYPVYDLSLGEGNLDLLAKGSPAMKTGFGEVLVNDQFASNYPFDVIGKTISAHYEAEIKMDEVSEHVVLEYSFRIAGIINELSFMSEPRVYYSYLGLQNYLSLVELEHFGKTGKTRYSILDFMEDQSEDSPYLKYRYLLFVHDKKQVKSLYERIQALEGTSLSLDSDAYEVRKAFLALMEAFASSLLLIVGFSMFALSSILAMMAFSSYSARKKENAVLMSLGAGKEEIVTIFGFESSLVCLACALASLVISLPLSRFANSYLQGRFGLANIIDIPWGTLWSIPYLLIWGLPLLAWFMGFIFGALPIALARPLPLAEELRDE